MLYTERKLKDRTKTTKHLNKIFQLFELRKSENHSTPMLWDIYFALSTSSARPSSNVSELETIF